MPHITGRRVPRPDAAHCRGSDLPLTPTLPFGVGDRHAWLGIPERWP
jgi:hypothetical protein